MAIKKSDKFQKGSKVRLVDRYDLAVTSGVLGTAPLSLSGLFYRSILGLQQPVEIGAAVGGVIGVSVAFSYGLTRFLYSHTSFFAFRRYRRNLVHYLLSHNLYDIKRVEGKEHSKEKMVLNRVYLRKPNSYEIVVSFQLNGSKNLSVYDSIPKDLEIEFFGDFKKESDYFDNRWHSVKTYKIYTFAIENKRNRVPLSEVRFDKKLGLKLMNGVYWNPDEQPHLLVAGGTGGGKTVFLFCLLLGLLQVGEVDICDPKRSDFVEYADEEKYPAFKGRVFFEIEDMVQCLRDAVDEMDWRYDYMTNHPNHVSGGKYSDYGLTPKFIMVDEVAALVSALESREYQKLYSDFYNSVTLLVLKGRQAGVFLIMAMQRPDVHVLPGSLRDNFMTRLGLGRLSLVGQSMVHGDLADKKNFKYLEGEIGRGYFSTTGSNVQEFYAPFIPFDKGFKFEEEFAKIPPIENKMQLELKVSQEREKELEQLSTSSLKEKTYSAAQIAQLLHENRRTIDKVIQLLKDSGRKMKAMLTEDDRLQIKAVFNFSEENGVSLADAVDFLMLDLKDYEENFINV